MSNQFGIVCTSRVLPPPGEQAALGVRWTRAILYSLDEIPALLDQVGSGRLILALNNENSTVGGDWSGWENALHAIASYGSRIAAVQCGNRLDAFWAANDQDCPPTFGASLVNRAQAILRPSGISTLLSSVEGERWQEWLEEAAGMCVPNGVCLQPYGQRPDGFAVAGWGFGELRAAITQAYELSGGYPVYLTEVGVKLADAGGEGGQAQYARALVETIASLGARIVPAACYFAFRDDVGTPDEQGASAFGLRRPDGSARPAWLAYQQAIVAAVRASPPSDDPVPLPSREPVSEQNGATVLDVGDDDPVDALSPTERAFAALWRAQVPNLALNPDAAFYQAWRTNPEAMGSPVSGEIADDDGSVVQAFARGVWRWTGGAGVERVA